MFLTVFSWFWGLCSLLMFGITLFCHDLRKRDEPLEYIGVMFMIMLAPIVFAVQIYEWICWRIRRRQ